MYRKHHSKQYQHNAHDSENRFKRPTTNRDIIIMTSATTSANIQNLYFEYKDLTQISGEPTFSTLHYMLLQLKANESSVPSELGGGAHGYVGAILSPVTYATLAPMTPFVPPVHQDDLTVPPMATQYQISLAKFQHENALQVFNQYQLVQMALIQQVLEAINAKFLTRLRNRVIGQVSIDIRDLIMSLFCIYGKISANQLQEK